MLGLSRWSEKGGSYQTLQRLYHKSPQLAHDSLDISQSPPR